MAALEIDGRSPVPPADEDPWVTTVLEPRWDAMPAAESALAAIAQNLPAASAAVRRPAAWTVTAWEVLCKDEPFARLVRQHMSRSLECTTLLEPP